MPVVESSAVEAERIARASEAATLGNEGLPTLMALLDDPSWVVRRAVVRLLASAGEPAAVALLHELRTARDVERRLAAIVDALVHSSAPIDERVLELQTDPNPAVVADMVTILGRRRVRAAVPVLRRLLEGDDDVLAVTAIEALGRIGGRFAVDSLVDAVRSGRFFRTFPAIDVLGRTRDPRALAPLTELLEDPRYGTDAARALGNTGDPGAVEPLLEQLGLPGDARVRVAALALVTLRDTYATLYGNAEVIELLIRERAVPIASRPLIAAMHSAAVAEQAALVTILGMIGSEEAFAVLTEQLDGPEQVARPAAEALKKLGTHGMLTLSSALRDGSSARRRLLLDVVQPSSLAIDDVIVTLGDPDGAVRAKGCELLGRMGQSMAVPALFELLRDPNPRVSHAALGAIQRLGGELAEMLSVEAADSSDVRIRRQAFRLIGHFGFSAGIAALVRGTEDPDPALRELAVQCLGYVDEPWARAAVCNAADHTESRMRAAAMRALACSERAVGGPRLLDGLEDEDAWVRYYACQSLGRLQYEDAAAAIARRLVDPAGHVRLAAIEALSLLESPEALAHLVARMRSPDEDVRRACLTGLASAKRLEALPLLLEATRASEAATRLVAASAIAAFDAPEVPRRLGELAASDADEAVRFAALGALGELPGRAATRVAIELLWVPALRPRVHELLSRSVPGRIEGLVEGLTSADDEVAPVLTSALARMRSPEAQEALLVALELENPAARKAAASTAAAVGSQPLLDALRDRAEADPDPEVRRIIASVLRS